MGETEETRGNVSQPVLLDISADGQIATLTLNRAEARNAVDRLMAEALVDILGDLGERRLLRAMVVTGAGARAFSAGADLKERLRLSPDERSAHTEAIATAAERLAALPVPTVAALRGFALAGGAELALACDLRVAGMDVVIGFPEVRVGVFPGAGGVVRLPRLVGTGVATDLLLTGRRVDAQEAYRLGLVDRLVASEDVVATAQALAGQIAENAPLAVRAAKQALAASAVLPAMEAARIVREYRRALDASEDYAEGLAAFAEGRPPRFRGE